VLALSCASASSAACSSRSILARLSSRSIFSSKAHPREYLRQGGKGMVEQRSMAPPPAAAEQGALQHCRDKR
jgi:hypothetical protein